VPRFAASIPAAIAFLALLSPAARVSARQESPGRDNPPALSAINERLRHFVEGHEIAGATTLVATRDGIGHLGAIGKADIAHDKPMRPDTIFWIASMTKPVTATAVPMLQDEGKLSIDDRVEKQKDTAFYLSEAQLLMVQRSNFGNSDASEVRRAFQQAAASALEASN